MADGIILVIVALFLIAALKGTAKHFKGEGGCCGGGSCSVPKKGKKLGNPAIGKMVVRISGMHCQNCANAVSAAINKMDGVSARVSLRGKKAIVTYGREIGEDELRRVVEDAGYRVVSISH